jgi:hypothetical protein
MMIEEQLELNFMTLIRTRMQAFTGSFAVEGSWQVPADGKVKEIEINKPEISLITAPIENDAIGVNSYMTTINVDILVPRSQDPRALIRNQIAAIMLPFIRSFAGNCNATIKAALSGDDYKVVGTFDEGGANTYDNESGLWVISRVIKVKLTTK